MSIASITTGRKVEAQDNRALNFTLRITRHHGIRKKYFDFTRMDVILKIDMFPTPIEQRFWSKVNKGPHPNGCWLWTGAVSGGYGVFWGNYGPGAHRVSWALANGPIPGGQYVLHDCPNKHNPLCVNPSHLKIGTQKDNVADQTRMGTRVFTRGEACKKSKTNEATVRLVRLERKSGMMLKEIAARHGLSVTTVHDICSRTWKHVV